MTIKEKNEKLVEKLERIIEFYEEQNKEKKKELFDGLMYEVKCLKKDIEEGHYQKGERIR